MKKKLLFYILFLLSIQLYSQSSVVPSGGNATGSGTVNYTVGQTFYNTINGTTGSLAEGVQHLIVISTLSGHHTTSVKLNAEMYPNPTSDYIILDVNNNDLHGLHYILYDISGKIILNGKVESEKTSISMKNFTAGVYILKVNSTSKKLKTFKIIKK